MATFGAIAGPKFYEVDDVSTSPFLAKTYPNDIHLVVRQQKGVS